MINNLFRITFVTFVWSRYKAIIISTLLLFLFFFIVSQVHQDYVSYAELNGDKANVGLSFIAKWCAFIGGFVLYFWLNMRFLASNKKSVEKDEPKLSRLEKVIKKPKKKEQSDEPDSTLDPFDAIRKKDKLKSEADFIIDRE